MNNIKSIIVFLLRPWALIPGLLLFIFTFIVAGVAGMSAEDVDRPLSLLEKALFILPLLPATWFVFVIAKFKTNFKSINKAQNSEKHNK